MTGPNSEALVVALRGLTVEDVETLMRFVDVARRHCIDVRPAAATVLDELLRLASDRRDEIHVTYTTMDEAANVGPDDDGETGELHDGHDE